MTAGAFVLQLRMALCEAEELETLRAIVRHTLLDGESAGAVAGHSGAGEAQERAAEGEAEGEVVVEEEEEEAAEREVGCILDQRTRKRKPEFLVQWAAPCVEMTSPR